MPPWQNTPLDYDYEWFSPWRKGEIISYKVINRHADELVSCLSRYASFSRSNEGIFEMHPLTEYAKANLISELAEALLAYRTHWPDDPQWADTRPFRKQTRLITMDDRRFWAYSALTHAQIFRSPERHCHPCLRSGSSLKNRFGVQGVEWRATARKVSFGATDRDKSIEAVRAHLGITRFYRTTPRPLSRVRFPQDPLSAATCVVPLQ